MLNGKKILIGVCGSIAAYKTAMLTRLLVKEGAEVKIIMTSSATEFITPLTLSTLSKNPVLTTFTKGESGEWNNHVDLGLWADLLVIAPASANTIAHLANGICNNLLSAVYLSARCPVFLAPAMDLDMYKHPSTLSNLEKLKSYGNHIIDAENGELASGLYGTGRMAEPENIVSIVQHFFENRHPLKGKTVLITAGPTYEAIDPVRFIGNSSTGKMGYAIAETMAEKGAKVVLVSGPVALKANHPNIETIKVTSAAQMYEKSLQFFPSSQIAILAAAVADYTPKFTYDQKVKKHEEGLTLELIKTKDIALELGKLKSQEQFIAGFALETEQELQNAFEKLRKKNFDLIVLNSLNDQGAGFGHDTNKISIIDKDNKTQEFGLKTKKEVAIDIVNAIITKINA